MVEQVIYAPQEQAADPAKEETIPHDVRKDFDNVVDIDEESGERTFADAPQKSHNQQTKMKPILFLLAVTACLGGAVFGYDLGGAGGTFIMPGFQEHFGWCQVNCTASDQQQIDRDQAYINGLFGAGATIGAAGGPWSADKFGRRPCMFGAAITFIIGAAMQMGAPTMTVMFIGRLIAGFGIGALAMCSPVYTAEHAPDHTRGMLASIWQLSLVGGLLIASACNVGLENWDEGWRLSYGGNIVFAILLLIALCFLPESPRWLTAHGRDDETRKVFAITRYPDDIEHELEELALECEAEKQTGVASWAEVFSVDNQMRHRLLIGIALQATMQLCGINAVNFYAPSIFKTFFSETGAIVGTFILMFIHFFSTFVAFCYVDKVGRPFLFLVGGITMIMALIVDAVLAAIPQTEKVGYAVVAFSAVYIAGFAATWGPVTWIVCAEMFPKRARGKGTGLTTMTNFLCQTIVGAVFPLASAASLSGTFVFFAVCTVGGLLVVYFYLPETARKTMLEIDNAFANHKPKLVRKLR